MERDSFLATRLVQWEKEKRPMNTPNSQPTAPSDAGINGTSPEDRGHQENTGEVAYEAVPPKRTVTVSVRHRIRGRGQSLPYPVDEGDIE
jgi:hypothetical protein